MKREINDAWENRDNIQASCQGAPKPKVIEILKLLPRTNCKDCGMLTCMVFAVRMAEKAEGPDDCPALGADSQQRLNEYMSKFKFDC